MSMMDQITRLQLNWKEVPGVKRSLLFEPSSAVEKSDLPVVYPTTLGRMNTSIPATSAGQYIVERDYIYSLLIAEAEGASTDSGDYGMFIDNQSVSLIDAPLDYFMIHPRLNTATLPELERIVNDIKVRDSGVVTVKTVDGSTYRAVQYTITIAERRLPTPARIS